MPQGEYISFLLLAMQIERRYELSFHKSLSYDYYEGGAGEGALAQELYPFGFTKYLWFSVSFALRLVGFRLIHTRDPGCQKTTI